MRILPLSYYIPTLKGLIYNMLHKEDVFPFYASFKLTSRCHFACPFCNVKNDRINDLSTDQIKAVLDNLSQSSVLMTSFEGGEPLLRKDIRELLCYAREKCKFYLLFTTSVKNILDYPLEDYSNFIDFFHISIDEGHNNLELFDVLGELVRRIASQVSVQTVVTKNTLYLLEEKVRACYFNKANIVVIPATHMDGTENYFPDIYEFEKVLLMLKNKYPFTIHTPKGYLDSYRKKKCSSASIIIASDGRIFYPCHIKQTKGPSLIDTNLSKWLISQEAKQMRKAMKECTRNCGWYQYYSINSYTSFYSVFEALSPMILQKRKRNIKDIKFK